MSPNPEAIETELAELRGRITPLRSAIESSFLGQSEVVEQTLLCFLAGGHALIEGVPGLGKTTLVRTVAAGLDLEFRRIQFTPDLMPGDVIGARILEETEDGRRQFRFERGPIFANVILADEINRATPRTQSALLEAMQERQVTAHGETLRLEEPFFLVATQNPIEMEGTYPLPEAQLDRFHLRIDVAYPDAESLAAILARTPTETVTPSLGRQDSIRLQSLVRAIPTSSDIVHRVARLLLATHPDQDLSPPIIREHVRQGASPRGGEALLATARARALLRGRIHVEVEDLEALAAPALRHRLMLGYGLESSRVQVDELVHAALRASE